MLPRGSRMAGLQHVWERAATMDQDELEKAICEIRRCEAFLSDELERRRRACEEAICSRDENTSIPGKVLDQVCLSKFLTVEECGRLLLLVSKSMLQHYGHQHAWEIICRQKWQNVAHVPKTICDRKGYEWVFRQLSVGQQSYDLISSFKPPTLSLKMLTLLISVRNAAMAEVVSIALRDDPLSQFLENGELNVSLKETVELGKFPVSEDGALDFVAPRISKWTATMHLLRSDRAQCVCLHKTVACSWGEYDYLDDPNIEEERQEYKDKEVKVGSNNTVSTVTRPKVESKIPPMEVDMGYMEFTTDGLELSRRGKHLEDRIRDRTTTMDAYDCLKFEPTLICHTRDYCESSNSVELVSNELRLDLWKRYCSGAAELYHSHN